MSDVPAAPSDREALLARIRPENAAVHHELLRELFRVEMAYRSKPGDHEFFENLYQCAFLLNRVGDPSDVPMMWEAKHLNMDTGGGFDVEFMVGAGVEETLSHLRAHGDTRIAEGLSELLDPDSDLDQWAHFRGEYFYP